MDAKKSVATSAKIECMVAGRHEVDRIVLGIIERVTEWAGRKSQWQEALLCVAEGS